MSYDDDAIRRFLDSVLNYRDLTIPLSAGTETRVQAYIDRLNHDPVFSRPEDQRDPFDDEHVVENLLGLIDLALSVVEAEAGLVGFVDGRLISAEQQNEKRARSLEKIMDDLYEFCDAPVRRSRRSWARVAGAASLAIGVGLIAAAGRKVGR